MTGWIIAEKGDEEVEDSAFGLTDRIIVFYFQRSARDYLDHLPQETQERYCVRKARVEFEEGT